MRAWVILLFAIVSPGANAEEMILCNGGSGPAYWSSTARGCYQSAGNRAQNDAGDAAKKGERAERQARDSKTVGDQLSKDRNSALARSPEDRLILLSQPYALSPQAAAAAERVRAERAAAGLQPLPMPRDYRELIGASDYSLAWKKYSVGQAEDAAKFFESAAGGVEASRKFQQLAAETKRRGDSLISLGDAPGSSGLQGGQAPTGASARAASARMAGPQGAPGGPAGEGAKVSPNKDAKSSSASKPSDLRVSAGSKDAGVSGIPPGPAKDGAKKDKKESSELEKLERLEASKAGANKTGDALDLFERALAKAENGAIEAPVVAPMGEVAAPAERADDLTIFGRVSRQYRKREPVLVSVFSP